MARGTIRIEIGSSSMDAHKLILPDGRDVMHDLLPSRIEVSLEANGFTRLTIESEAMPSVVAEIMHTHDTITGNGPVVLPDGSACCVGVI